MWSASAVEEERGGDAGEVVGGVEVGEAAGVEDGEGGGVAVGGGVGSAEHGVLADEGVDAQGVFGGVVVGGQVRVVEESAEAVPVVDDVFRAVAELVCGAVGGEGFAGVG